MRSMLQLLGGVAVAGAVAAGTTAFTAGGVTNSVTALPGAGNASITVNGATLSTAVFDFDTSGAANYDHITGIHVTLAGNSYTMSDANTKVSAAFTGTTSGATTSGTAFDCGAGTSGVWNCDIPSTDYYTQVDTVVIKVAPKV